MVKIQGLNNILKDLEKIKKNLKENVGEQSISFNEIFSYEFMNKNTNVNSIDEFFLNAGINVGIQGELDEDVLDEYVVNFTHFPSWDELKATAAKEFFSKKIFG